MAERKTQDEINDLTRDHTEGFEAHTLRGQARGAGAAYVDCVVRTLCQPFNKAH